MTELSMVDLDIEVEALDRNIRADNSYLVTQKQVVTLASLLSQGISDPSDRDLRIAVLRVFLGKYMKDVYNVTINSTKQITGPAAYRLIELIKDEDGWTLSRDGKRLLALAEERTKVIAVQD